MKPTVSETRIRGLTLGVERADGGVEGGEELVGDEHLAPGEGPHQGRLAGVGVADQRHSPRVSAAWARRTPCSFWMASELLRAARRCGHGSCADRARARSRRRPCPRCCSWVADPLPSPPASREARRDVVEAGDPHFQAGLAAPGVAVEDLDDDAGAIEHLRARRALEVPRLTRGDLVVDHDHGRAARGRGDIVRGEVLFILVGVGLGGPARPGLVLLGGSSRRDDARSAGHRRELVAASSPSTAADASAVRFCEMVATTSCPSVWTSRLSSARSAA